MISGICCHQNQCQPVIAFNAHRLDHGGCHALLRGQGFIEFPDALYVLISAGRIGHSAFAHHIIGNDQRARRATA